MEPPILIIIAYLGAITCFGFIVKWAYKAIRKQQGDLERIPLTVVIEQTDTGYSCYIQQEQFSGVAAEADNIQELKRNITYSIIDHIDFMNDSVDSTMGYCDFEIKYVNQ